MTLSTTGAKSRRKLTEKRRMRLVDDVQSLMAMGLSCMEIGKRLGISHAQAADDMNVVRELWAENTASGQIAAVRGEAIARCDFLYQLTMEGIIKAKEHNQYSDRLINCAANLVKEKVRLSGADIDLKLVQQNVNVQVASAEELKGWFEPMDAADFKAFAAAHAEAQRRAADATAKLIPVSDRPILEEAEELLSESDWTSEGVIESDDTPKKNRRVSHPIR